MRRNRLQRRYFCARHGLLGSSTRRAAKPISAQNRSLSALTWCVQGTSSGFPLHHHNVFFGDDYPSEFDALFRQRNIVSAPTVYVCAQDRTTGDADLESSPAPERLLVLINAPADGDVNPFTSERIDELAENTFGLMRDCGLVIETDSMQPVVTSPSGFNSLFPATGGALYGRANHGSMASFARPGAASDVPGLYLAGGSVHPGAGVPMTTLSGRLAAAKVIEDFGKRA